MKHGGVITIKTPLLFSFDRNCGLEDPTWLEISHYVHFLSVQLKKARDSPFCSSATTDAGFKDFVISFMLKMAQVCDEWC